MKISFLNSIKNKLSLVSITTMSSMLIILSFLYVYKDYKQYNQLLKTSLDSITTLVGDNSLATLLVNDNESATDILKSLDSQKNIIYAGLLTKSHASLGSYKKSAQITDEVRSLASTAKSQSKQTSTSSYKDQGDYLMVMRAVRYKNNTAGYIYVIYDTSERKDKMIHNLGLTVVVLVFSIFIALLISTYYQNLIIKPLINLSDRMKEISDTKNFNIKIGAYDKKDEVGLLMNGFNDMLDQLKVRDVEIKNKEVENLKIEKQLHQAQKMESIGTLAAGIAHDFNNLLNSAIGYIELIKSDLSQNSKQMEYLNQVDTALENAAVLVKGLLGFAQKGKAVELPVQPNKLITEAVKLLSRTIGKTTEVITSLGDNISRIKGDANQLQQVLMNLFINAHHAMDNKGELTITTANIFGSDEDVEDIELLDISYVKITVSDIGSGIAPDKISHIFDPFYTTKPMGKGSGLGLSSAYGIIKNHHGLVSVTSTIGKGTTFKLYFPAIDGEKTIIKNEKKPDVNLKDIEKGSEHLALDKKNLLIIDDEEMIRYLLKTSFSKDGATVHLAADGKAGVDVYRKNYQSIDLVVLDLIMPIMGGDVCLAELKAINPNIKVIICSGYAQNETLKKVNTELNDNIRVITKPIKPSNLRKLILKMLNKASESV